MRFAEPCVRFMVDHDGRIHFVGGHLESDVSILRPRPFVHAGRVGRVESNRITRDEHVLVVVYATVHIASHPVQMDLVDGDILRGGPVNELDGGGLVLVTGPDVYILAACGEQRSAEQRRAGNDLQDRTVSYDAPDRRFPVIEMRGLIAGIRMQGR